MAITRAQQVKQMLKQGGRTGFFTAGLALGDDISPGTSGGGNNRDNDGGSDAREAYIRDYASKGIVKGGGKKKPGTTGTSPDDYEDRKVTGDDVRKAKDRYEKQFYDRGIVPPLGSRPTDLRTKINQRNKQKRLNYINNLISSKRKKIIDAIKLAGIEGVTEENFDELYNKGMLNIPSVADLVEQGFYSKDGRFATEGAIPEFTSMRPPGLIGLLTKPFEGPLTTEGIDNLLQQTIDLENLKTTEGIEGTTFNELMKTYDPNRFKLENPETRGGPDQQLQDPCKGPNPPAYCFIGQNADDNMEAAVTRNLAGLTPRIGGSSFDFTQFAADGGRIGFKGGADFATVADSKGNVGAKSVSISPSGSVTTSKTRGPDPVDDRSTFEQTVNQRNVINRARRPEPSGLEKLYRTGSELNFLRNLAIGNFPGLGKQLMFELGKKKFLDDQAMLDTENDNMMLADLTDLQKQMLKGPQKNLKDIMGISNEEILQNIKDFDNPEAPATIQDIEEFYQQAKDGGIMNLDREAFLLGGIAKGLKKATRAVKKIAKSPIGKAALIAGGGYLLGGGIIPGVSGKFIPFAKYGSSAGSGFGFGNILPNILNIAKMPGLAEKAFSMGTTGKALTGILGASILPLIFGKKPKDDFDLDAYYAANELNPNAPLNTRIAGSEFDFYGGQTAADGGRIGYQEGGDAEPVAKKTMPLIDMDGKEKDYRETGGFVDMGRMERADDVPARLSKNEFVFTADAVRNAGEGDIDKGAEVMYNMMKNLEAGGEVSEESQGLEGAREMFQTSQRLGEVI